MLHFCFSLKCSSFLQILSLWKGRFYLLSGIAITTGDWWNQRKKTTEDKFDYHENEQIAYYAPEISKFFSCYDCGMTLRLWRIFFTRILKIDEQSFLYIDPCVRAYS